MPKRCAECGKFIRADQSVCDYCAAKYTRDYNTLVSRPHTIQKDTVNQYYDDDHSIDFVAVELKKDISIEYYGPLGPNVTTLFLRQGKMVLKSIGHDGHL